MKVRGWPILAVGFGSLILLTLLFGLDSLWRTRQIYGRILSIHQTHTGAERVLRELESGIYLSEIFMRDFLLDPSQLTAPMYRQRLRGLRSSMEKNLAELGKLPGQNDSRLLVRLRGEIDSYWDSMDPLFEWTPRQKSALSSLFMRREVLPRRNAVLEMAREVQTLMERNFAERQRQIDVRMTDFRRSGERMLLVAVVLGLVVSVATIYRLWRLEGRAEQHRLATEQAEHELRRLSHQLVHAQEDERRSISRELHDEVGQTLTALRMELGNLEKLRHGTDERFREHLDDARRLVEQTLKSVRSMAAGLRPSILDDLGLGPALEWQAREFSRRTGIPVEVFIAGIPGELSEAHRTCLYRVVQEGLTNCARHAQARNIRIALHARPDRLSLIIQDDGIGIEGGTRQDRIGAPAIGLLGIAERVKELGGALDIHSQRGKGTVLKISIPIHVEVKA